MRRILFRIDRVVGVLFLLSSFSGAVVFDLSTVVELHVMATTCFDCSGN